MYNFILTTAPASLKSFPDIFLSTLDNPQLLVLIRIKGVKPVSLSTVPCQTAHYQLRTEKVTFGYCSSESTVQRSAGNPAEAPGKIEQ